MHTIHNIAFDWELNNVAEAVHIENKCNRIIQDRILPKIEQQLDLWNANHPGMKCIIPDININILCTEFSIETIEYMLLRQFNTILEEKTKIAAQHKKHPDTSEIRMIPTAMVTDFVLHYLKNGFSTNIAETISIEQWSKDTVALSQSFIATSITLITDDIRISKRFLTLFDTTEIAFNKLFKNETFYQSTDFITQFLVAVLAELFPEKDMITQIAIWKTILTSSSSINRCIDTLYSILQSVVSFRHNTTETIFLLTTLLLQVKCQIEVNRPIAIKHAIENIFLLTTKTAISNTDTDENKKTSLEIIEQKEISKKIDPKTIRNQENKVANSIEKKLLYKKNLDATLDKEISKKDDTAALKKQINVAYQDMMKPTKPQTSADVSMIDIKISANNVGLFILHPFLKEFFREAGILIDREIVNPDKGVQLLHYLATGNDTCKDIAVQTEKIIIGIPLYQPIFGGNSISEKEKNLCDALLKAILKHWTVLEKSGIDTLRSMFLIRQGTIEFKGKNIHIEADHLAQDILLKKLPWGLGMVLLPWFKGMFQINWKS